MTSNHTSSYTEKSLDNTGWASCPTLGGALLWGLTTGRRRRKAGVKAGYQLCKSHDFGTCQRLGWGGACSWGLVPFPVSKGGKSNLRKEGLILARSLRLDTGTAWWQELEGAALSCPQSGSRRECECSARSPPFSQPRTPPQRVLLLTIKMNLPTSISIT